MSNQEKQIENTKNEKTEKLCKFGGPGRKGWKKLFLSLFVIILVVAGIAGIGFTQKLKHMQDDGPLPFLIEKIAQDLDLNEQQKAEVMKIRDEIKAKGESKRHERENGFNEFEKLFKQDKLDKQSLKQLAEKHEADREEMKEFFIDELIKFHSILTPQQRVKAVEKMKSMREKMRKIRDIMEEKN